MPTAPPHARLFAIPDNRPPSGATVELVTTRDGLGLRAARWWSVAGQPRGTVCIFQGRSEFIEKYFELIGDLRSRGFAVAILDWRGQGGSQRLMPDHRPGHVERFTDYQLDVEAFMRQLVLSDCPPPYYALAHSMGAAVLFDLLEARPLWFERLVAIGPMIDLPNLKPGSRGLARTLRALGMGRWRTPGMSLGSVALKPFAGNPVTTDTVRYARAAETVRTAPMLGIGAPTIGWVDEAFQVMARLADPRFGRDWRTPTLILAAGLDNVVSTPAAEALGARLRATRTITLVGALHELAMERDAIREQFLAAFDAFIPGTTD